MIDVPSIRTMDSHNSSPPPSSNLPAISPQLRRRLDRHFLTCSATVGATLAGVAVATGDAKADIVYSGTQNITVPYNNFGGIYIDFDTGAHSTSQNPGSDANLFDVYSIKPYNNQPYYYYHATSFYGPNHYGNAALSIVTDDNFALKLNAGQSIGPNQNLGDFTNTSKIISQYYNYYSHAVFGSPKGNWTSGGTGYIGFRFVDSHGQTDYGWIQLSLNLNNFFANVASATILDWAYNNSGGPIAAGQIPEPSSMALALLGGGAVGLALWRKHRRLAQQRSTAQK